MAGRVVVSAAKQVAKGAVRPRRRRALRAPLNITPAAAEQVKEILSSNEEALGVRLGVKTRESFLLFVVVVPAVHGWLSLLLFFFLSPRASRLCPTHISHHQRFLSRHDTSPFTTVHTLTLTHTHT